VREWGTEWGSGAEGRNDPNNVCTYEKTYNVIYNLKNMKCLSIN
jgi:hypothetical protein